ncbi:acetyltransferase [Vampirovibrio chlorellavorus]|uniref:acetyltransferase n=1 Tax=Vampirovibrio chlorellavorus TaxID=758823 RepID=UPI0026E98FDC|nr:acetyltransferase [Vampirovibrio chlorellavorus]
MRVMDIEADRPKAVIVGTGGHAQVLWAAWQTLQNTPGQVSPLLMGWLEHAGYQGPTHLMDLPVYPETEAGLLALSEQGVWAFYFGIGMVTANPKRWDIFQRVQGYGFTPKTLIHPTAVVDSSAIIGPGCFIGARSVIQPFVKLGAAAIVNTGSIVEHHADMGQNVHVAPGSILCGHSQVGDHSLIGAGAIVLQQVSVGRLAAVGAGSVVLQSVAEGATVVGNPARPVLQGHNRNQMGQESVVS